MSKHAEPKIESSQQNAVLRGSSLSSEPEEIATNDANPGRGRFPQKTIPTNPSNTVKTNQTTATSDPRAGDRDVHVTSYQAPKGKARSNSSSTRGGGERADSILDHPFGRFDQVGTLMEFDNDVKRGSEFEEGARPATHCGSMRAVH